MKLAKRLIWIAVVVALVVVVILSFRPRPLVVDAGTVAKGRLVVTVQDDGITRVRERFLVSAPIQGRLLRTLLDPGDRVSKGETVVAEFAPITPNPLDERSLEEARARLSQADAAVKEATARLKQAEADSKFFLAELSRVEQLVAKEIRTDDALDRAKRDHERAGEALRAAGFAVEMARFGRALAEAGLREVAAPSGDRHREVPADTKPRSLKLRSPIAGQVLRVYEESARTVAPGTPILELGDVRTLEVVADFLSQDAVKVEPGMRVRVEGWGGSAAAGQPRSLPGRVRLVEPSGFTKISALGVEEQRVNIIIDPDPDAAGDPRPWSSLGDGFRVEPKIELWAADDVLLVPTGALFREAESWAVFAIEAGVATRKKIRIGRRSGLQAQVLEGLMSGERVILYPSDLIVDGAAVTPR